MNLFQATFVKKILILIFLFHVFLFQKIYAKEKKVILKLATLAPISSIWGVLIKDIRKDVYLKTQKTDQKVILKAYYGGVQGDEVEMGKKILYGQLDGGFFTGNGLGAICKEARILDLPLNFKSFKEAKYVYKGIQADINAYFKKKGFFLLGIAPMGYAYFFSKKNIQTFEDIRRSKMWIWKGDKLVYEAMKIMKIPSVSVGFNEVKIALQTGLINGVYATPTALISLQWYQEISYMLDQPLAIVSSGVVFDLKSWKKLSSKNQNFLSSIIAKRLEEMAYKSLKSDEISLKELKKKGMKINPSKQPKQTVIDFTLKLKENLKGKIFSKELLFKVNQLLKEFR